MRRLTCVRRLQPWLLLEVILACVFLALETHARTLPPKETEVTQLSPAPTTSLQEAEAGQSGVKSTIELVETALTEGAKVNHLKCYNVLEDSLAEDPTTEENLDKTIIDLPSEQFSEEADCTLFSKARLFCTSTVKEEEANPSSDDSIEPPLTSDFLCYRVKCPNPELREISLVEDQFGSRSIIIRSSRFLCVPATATTTSSIPCGQSAPECNGACEHGLQCQSDTISGVCVCQPNSGSQL